MAEEEKQKDINSTPRLRTFETDIINYVKEKGLSLADLASSQAKFRGLEFQEDNHGRLFSKKIIILLVVIILMALGGGFSFLFFNKDNKERSAIILEEPIMAYDEKTEVIVSVSERQKLLRDIKAAIESNSGINKLISILLIKQSPKGSKKMVGVKEIFELTGIAPPRELLDSFDGGKFMLLKIYLNGANWPVLIFEIASYNYAFSGMLKWENTIVNDLRDIFPGIDTNQTKNSFLDQTIQNRDARVLKNTEGKVVLAYSFVNREYLAITGDIKPLQEIFRRLASQ